MANYQVAFDNADAGLGAYFEQSSEDLIRYISLHDNAATINKIDSPKCNQAYIDILIPQLNERKFLFVAYSHGMDDYLHANAVFYVRAGVNSNLFINSLFYSMSCSCGKSLAPALIKDGCLAFIGYDDLAWALNGTYAQISIECDNFGIKRFISGDNVKDAYIRMKNNFNTQIDYLLQQGEILLASYLRKNRDALVIFGNETLRFNEF